MARFDVKVELNNAGVLSSGIKIKQYSRGVDSIRFLIYRGGNSFDPSKDFEKISLRILRADGQTDDVDVSFNVDSSGNYYFEHQFDYFDSFVAGVLSFEIFFFSTTDSGVDGLMVSPRINLEVYKSISSFNIVDKKSIDFFAHLLDEIKALQATVTYDEYIEKLNGALEFLKTVQEGAEVNVQSDWEEIDERSDAYIKNKPEIDGEVNADSSNAVSNFAVATKFEEVAKDIGSVIDAKDLEFKGIVGDLDGRLNEHINETDGMDKKHLTSAELEDVRGIPRIIAGDKVVGLAKDARNADKAHADENGNIIHDTYETKKDVENKLSALDYNNLNNKPVIQGKNEDTVKIGGSAVIGKDSIAIGSGNLAGCMGYHIRSIDTVNKKIYLTADYPTSETYPTVSTDDYTDIYMNTPAYKGESAEGKNDGDEFSIILGQHYHFFGGKIKKILDNVVEYSGELPFTEIPEGLSLDEATVPHRFIFFVPAKPEVGVKNFAYGGVAEGENTKALGSDSHAEGKGTIAAGNRSHAEGSGTKAGVYAHAEGTSAIAAEEASHAEGGNTRALGKLSHAEGQTSQAIGLASHAEGGQNIAQGDYSHAEGGFIETIDGKQYSRRNQAVGLASHAEGALTEAVGKGSHTEGFKTETTGEYSHAEGGDTQASGDYSHAEGKNTVASGYSAHAEGMGTRAENRSAHAEGGYSKATGYYAHAEGYYANAAGEGSHAEGKNTAAFGDYQHVQGKFNIEDHDSKYAHIVGNGDSKTPSNAHTLDWEGNAWFAGSVSSGKGELITKEEVENLVTEIRFDLTKSEHAEDWVRDTAPEKFGIFKLVDVDETGDIYGVSYLINTFLGVGNFGYNQLWISCYNDATSIKYRTFDAISFEPTNWVEWATTNVVGDISQLSDTIAPGNRENLVSAINYVSEFSNDNFNAMGQMFDEYGAAIRELTQKPTTTVPEATFGETLSVNTPYNFGEQTELVLLFPTTAIDGDVIYITFESGETATNLTVDTSNTTDIDLVPEANTGYEIYAKYNGKIWIVKYSEYEVV